MFGIDFDKLKEWVGENKFVSTLIAISVGLTLLFGVLIFKNYSRKKVIVAALVKENNEINGLQKNYGNPTPENEEKLKQLVEENSSNSMSFYNKLAIPGKHSLDLSLSSTDFGSLLTKYREKAKSTLSAGKVGFPEESFFGFEKYIESSIKENPRAIGIALLQQEMFQWVFSNIANVGNCDIIKIHRKVQQEENEDRTEPVKNKPISRSLEFDLVIKTDEHQYSEIIHALTTSDKYLIKIKYLKLTNDNPTAQPMPKMMDGEDTQVSKSAYDTSFDFVEDESGDQLDDAGTRRYTRIAKRGPKFVDQVLGNEKITLALALELVLIEEVDDLMKKPTAKKKK